MKSPTMESISKSNSKYIIFWHWIEDEMRKHIKKYIKNIFNQTFHSKPSFF